jgi:exosortase B
MSTVLEQRSLPQARPRRWRPWLAVLAGLALLYVPTYVELAHGLWHDDAYAQGPIVLAVFAWLMWRDRAAWLEPHGAAAPIRGSILLAAGLALYVVGRSQAITVFEVASHIPVIVGVLLLLRGPRTVRALGFALFFLFFLVPMPGFILDSVTAPLKGFVSAVVEVLLHALGYPVARSGVVLTVGQYQMLVADACSGLNSLYSLFALGLLYVHLIGPASRLRTAVVMLAIVPIAVAANVVRVLALVLITYHFGDAVGEGFLHGVAGMLVFSAALAMITGLDTLLRPLWRGNPNRGRTPNSPNSESVPGYRTRTLAAALLAAGAMAGAAIAAPALRPIASEASPPDLERMVPVRFAGWQVDPLVVPIVPAPDVQANLERIYRQIVNRTYVNAAGERMMLTVAYGGDQSDALKAHRQEACYAAQGFAIRDLRHGELAAAGRNIPVTRMLAVRGLRHEPVTYWFTMGDRVVLGRLERLEVQLRSGLAGRIPDGMLVRVSNLSRDAAPAFAAQQAFVAAILAAMPERDARRLVGARTP